MNISKYLDKFFKKVNGDEEYCKRVVEIIQNTTGVTLAVDQIEIKNGILYTSASPLVKNKLYMFKESLLKEIATASTQKIIDIR